MAAQNAVKDFVKVVDGRIHALARAHNQITSDNWGPAPLRGLIETEAAAYLAGIAMLRWYRLSPQMMADVRSELELKRAAV